MWFILALLSSLANGLTGFVFKMNAMNKSSTEGLLWGFYLSGTVAFVIFVVLTNSFHLSWENIVAGIIIGFASAIGNLLFSKAIETGPAGLTMMISYSHVIFIIIISLFYYGENLTRLDLAGVLLLLISILLLPFDPNQKLRIHYRRWYLFIGTTCILFFIRNGGLKITEEMHLTNFTILLIAYLFGFVWFSAHLLLKRTSILKVDRTRILGLIAGILSFCAFQTYASAIASGPASIVSPIFTASGIIVTLLSFWIYKERLSIFQNISLFLLFIAIILLLV
jgi:drug/metabolite transporter (DMT)-like permease